MLNCVQHPQKKATFVTNLGVEGAKDELSCSDCAGIVEKMKEAYPENLRIKAEPIKQWYNDNDRLEKV